MSVLRELFVKLGLTVDEQSFAKGEIAADLVKTGLEKIVDMAKEVVEHINEVSESAEGIKSLSQAAGVTAESFQRMAAAASLENMGPQQLARNLVILSRTMKEVAPGAKTTEDAFEHLIEKFSKMPDGVAKTNLALKAFGRGGAEMIPVLNEGEEALTAMREAVVMTPEQVEAGNQVVGTQRAIAVQAKLLWTGAIAPLLPAVRDLLKQYLAWKKANGEIMKQRIREFLGYAIAGVKALGSVLSFLIRLSSDLAAQWKVLAVVVGSLAVAFGILNFEATAAGVAAGAAWLSALAPIVAVGAAISGILLVFNSLARWAEGKDSLIGEMFWKARLALEKFAEDSSFNDSPFVKMLRMAAGLVVFIEDGLDRTLHKMKAWSEAWEESGPGDSTLENLAAPTAPYAMLRMVRAAMGASKKIGDLPPYIPLDQRMAQSGNLAYSQAYYSGSPRPDSAPTPVFGSGSVRSAAAASAPAKVEMHFHGSPEENYVMAKRAFHEEFGTILEGTAGGLTATE